MALQLTTLKVNAMPGFPPSVNATLTNYSGTTDATYNIRLEYASVAELAAKTYGQIEAEFFAKFAQDYPGLAN
ncbi:hypothetical protein [Achromobacter xylosoxidans]|uniref:Uncharacterized protein n=1 Tax=Alcaligenes xylosoxydans xylosoxydans TaxID=85698 RepID=A0A1R1JX97_ALCXX|nr:hypothetical protein [Achromobacter xylosoxidans]OMG90712.1 hypothetical protein BIZ92_20605 [Achromobacter xylosoxidans]